MRIKETTIVLGLCLLSIGLRAQDFKPHSFALGLESALAQKMNFAPTTPNSGETYYNNTINIGVQAHYQRNYTSFFSLRFGGGYMYQFPFYDKNESRNASTGQVSLYSFSEQKWNNLYLFVAPMFYYRAEGFSLFLGPEIGVGFHFYQAVSKYSNRFDNGEWASYTDRFEERRRGYHLAPRGGISFEVGKQDNSEVEFSFSRMLWSGGLNETELDAYTEFGVQVGYRYNF